MSQPSTSSSTYSLSSQHSMQRLQELLNSIGNVEKESPSLEEGIQRNYEIIRESSQIISNSKSPNAMIVDAKILQTGTNYVNTNVTALKTSLISFDEEKYIRGVISYMEKMSEQLSCQNWESLAPVTYHLFKKSHSLTYMLGSFSLEPPPQREKVERQRQVVQHEKMILNSVTENSTPPEEGSDLYNHIFKCLINLFKKNQRKPLSYFNFIIDPTSYWRTVENIFHFAFLVRDGTVKMILLNGLPYVEPVLKVQGSEGVKTEKRQFCFTLNMSQWKKCIEKFNIRAPTIPPFVTKSKLVKV